MTRSVQSYMIGETMNHIIGMMTDQRMYTQSMSNTFLVSRDSALLVILSNENNWIEISNAIGVKSTRSSFSISSIYQKCAFQFFNECYIFLVRHEHRKDGIIGLHDMMECMYVSCHWVCLDLSVNYSHALLTVDGHSSCFVRTHYTQSTKIVFIKNFSNNWKMINCMKWILNISIVFNLTLNKSLRWCSNSFWLIHPTNHWWPIKIEYRLNICVCMCVDAAALDRLVCE
jgi:hypothetical protein